MFLFSFLSTLTTLVTPFILIIKKKIYILTTPGFITLQLQATFSNYLFNIFRYIIGISNALFQNCTNLCPCKSVLPQSFPFQLIVTPSFHLLPKTPEAHFSLLFFLFLSFNPSGNPVFVLPSRYIHLTATTTGLHYLLPEFTANSLLTGLSQLLAFPNNPYTI